MTNHSKHVLDNSPLKSDEKGYGTRLWYGILCPIEGTREAIDQYNIEYNEPLIRVGGNLVPEGDLERRVDFVWEKGEKDFIMEKIETDEDSQVGVYFIGVRIPTFMYAMLQYSWGIAFGEDLSATFKDSEKVIEDLKEIGFEDITRKDLCILAESYQH